MNETPFNQPGDEPTNEPNASQQSQDPSQASGEAHSDGQPLLAPGNERNLAALAHGLGILFPIIAPLLIWLTQKEALPAIEPACKEALNFQITFHGLFFIISFITCLPTAFFAPLACLTVPLLSIVLLVIIIFQIIATMSVMNGKPYRYPIRLELIK